MIPSRRMKSRFWKLEKKNVREKKARKRREKESRKQYDPINFPLTASNRELCHDSFQYSTNKKKNEQQIMFSQLREAVANFNIPVLTG